MTRSLRLLAPFLAALLLALVAAGAATAAEAEAPPAAESAAAGEEEAPMSVEFPRRRATLLGERALVFVKCSGAAAESCEGTLVLSGVRGSHKVPYSIARGERQALAVPLGEGDVDRGCKARVVARTLQMTGSTVRTSSLLRLG